MAEKDKKYDKGYYKPKPIEKYKRPKIKPDYYKPKPIEPKGIFRRGYESFKSGPGSPFDPIRKSLLPAQWGIFLIFKIIGWVLGIFIFVSIVIFIGNGIAKGELIDNIQIKLEEWGLSVPLTRFFDRYYSILSWESALSPEEDVFGFQGSTETEESDFGLDIESFTPRESVVSTNEPILTRSKIKVGEIPEDKQIELNFENACFLELDSDNFVTYDADPARALIMEGMEGRIFTVLCEFEGVSDDYVGFLGTREYDTKKIRFLPKFHYNNQKVSWYPLIKDVYSSGDEVSEPTWNVKKGPASLRLGSSESQPFYVDESGYVLYVNLKVDWQGDIKEIKNIELDTGDSIRLNTDSNFCDFKFSNGIYILKSEVLDEANIDCTNKDNLKAYAKRIGVPYLSTTDCLEKLKNEFTFECPFVVNNAESRISQTRVTANADYVFEMIRTTGIKVVKEEAVA